MSGLNCNVCGGELELQPQLSYGVCQFCGHKQPLSRADGAQIEALNHANDLRRQCEFDEAIEAYNDLLSRDSKNAEAHWGLLLSRYGVEYVKESDSEARKPTLHRLRKRAITSDPAYLQALKYAPDEEARALYQAEGEKIAGIQKGIIELIPREAPYDVFICYKENDGEGHLTEDYSLANAIYIKLTELGYRVFFANITLQGVLGSAYEPHIFSALNSARVMLVVATKREYANAVWVRNEWSRYLELIDQNPDDSRVLIPCYKGMRAYDLPEAFKMLQAQDLNSLTAMENLVRRIREVAPLRGDAPTPGPKPTPIREGSGSRELSNLRRLLAMGHYGDANQAAERLAGQYADSGVYWFYRAAARSRNFDTGAMDGEALSYLESARQCAEENPDDKNSALVLEACRQAAAKREAKEKIARGEAELNGLERQTKEAERLITQSENTVAAYAADMERKRGQVNNARQDKSKVGSQIDGKRFAQLFRFLLLLAFLVLGFYCFIQYYPDDYAWLLDNLPSGLGRYLISGRYELARLLRPLRLTPIYYRYGFWAFSALAVLTLLRMLNRGRKIKALKTRRNASTLTINSSDGELASLNQRKAEADAAAGTARAKLVALNQQTEALRQTIAGLREDLNWKYKF